MPNNQHIKSKIILINQHRKFKGNQVIEIQNRQHKMYNESIKPDLNILPILNHILNEILRNIQEVSAGKEGPNMDWQEKYFDQLEKNISEIKESFRHTEQHITQIVNQALDELRDRDNQRHSEIREIKDRLDAERRWIMGIAITVILSVATMVLTAIFS